MKQGSRLLIAENPLQVLPSLVSLVGLERAIILQQIHFLLGVPGGHNEDGYHWIHNTAQQWHDNYFTFWHPSSIQKWLKSLADDGFIVSRQFDKEKWDHKNYYRIDYDKLDQALADSALADSDDHTNDSASQAESQPLTKLNLDSACEAESLQRLQPETTTETTFTPDDAPLNHRPVKNPESEKTKPPAPEHNCNAHKCSPNYKLLFGAIARATETNPTLSATSIGKAAREFDRIGATPEDIEALRQWWDANDWRGKKHQPPTTYQLKECWQRAKDAVNGEAPAAKAEPAGYKGIREYVMSQMPQGA